MVLCKIYIKKGKDTKSEKWICSNCDNSIFYYHEPDSKETKGYYGNRPFLFNLYCYHCHTCFSTGDYVSMISVFPPENENITSIKFKLFSEEK